MEDAMQRNFTKKVCDEIFGEDPCWWINYTGCAESRMSHFYGMVGGVMKDRLNAWAVKVILEEERKMKEEKEQEKKLALALQKKLSLSEPVVETLVETLVEQKFQPDQMEVEDHVMTEE
jgi:hypothetical protein